MDPKYQASHSADYMSTYLDVNLFKTIIDQGKPLGLEAIKLTGGEPLLHPQIEEILRMISETHNRLIIETNGVLCTQSIAKLISQVSNQVFVSVSLDGCDSETHDWVRGVPGSFVSALEGIENLVKAGVKPQIVMALMRKNRDQIESVVQLAEEIGVSSVKFNPIQPIARGDLFHNNMENPFIHELVTIGAWVEKSLATRQSSIALHSANGV
jgi:SynChlorMet cassette radical SAM/SPASM protein ScmF